MKTASQNRIQIAAAILSFASLIVFAASAPRAPVANAAQSFIGTTPDAGAAEELPAQF